MSRKETWCALVIVLLTAAPIALHADKKGEIATASVKNGDSPPGNAASLSIAHARAELREAIKKRFVGTMKSCFLGVCVTWVLSEATEFRLAAGGFDVNAPFTADNHPGDGKIPVDFKKDQDYVQAYRLWHVSCSTGSCYNIGYLPKPSRHPLAYQVFEWPDEAAAQKFADAFNRLLYAAYHDEEEGEFANFSAAAKAWRENPAKPPLSPEAERQRILAENAISEKNFDSAVEHYESALEVQPMWPAGWFNLALIYAEQNNYADATDRMKHYLELVPDAPDANDARTQMIIWEDKAGKN
jgi:tetratricopeptide (TPR) repeat protein